MMATYYLAPRRQVIPSESICDAGHHSHHSQSDSPEIADSRTYIFPDPSFAPPSPSQASDLSEPSDLSSSTISVSDLGSQCSSPYHVLRTTPRRSSFSPWVSSPGYYGLDHAFDEVLPHLNSVNVESAHIQGGHRERCLVRHTPSSFPLPRPTSESGVVTPRDFRDLHPPLQASTPPIQSDLKENSESEHHHSLVHISFPLFSLFSMLPGIEKSTLDHLTSVSSSSILSPLENPLRMADNMQPLETFPAPHGLEKLFSVIAAEKGMRQGISYPHSSIPPLGFSGLWHLVTEIVANGGQLIRELQLI